MMWLNGKLKKSGTPDSGREAAAGSRERPAANTGKCTLKFKGCHPNNSVTKRRILYPPFLYAGEGKVLSL